MKHKVIIGRHEVVSLPDYLLTDIPAKIDTGAYTSAIHATNIKTTKKNGVLMVSCTLLGTHPNSTYSRDITMPVLRTARVDSSNGMTEERLVVSLKIKVANKVLKSEFTLTDRSKMTFPILIGRKLLNSRFLVDSSFNGIDKKTMDSLIMNDNEEK